MTNIVQSKEPADFYVYVDPKEWVTRHQIQTVGSFNSIPPDASGETLMFLPNEKYKTFVAPFQNNLLRNYRTEYNLEVVRKRYYPEYPSRLSAIFLLWREEDVDRYARRHPEHIRGRVLKKVKSVGKYQYSLHDSAWINFMRLTHSMDEDTLKFVGDAYWGGSLVNHHSLESMGRPWTDESIWEVLFLGRVDFYDTSLPDP